MALESQLLLLKMDIGLINPTAEQLIYLRFLINFAESKIRALGIRLVQCDEDEVLSVMYAAWLYRKRAQPAEATAMPLMLKYTLHNRLFSDKVRLEP